VKILVIDDEAFIRQIIQKFASIKKIDFQGIESSLDLKNESFDYDLYFVDFSIDEIDGKHPVNYIKEKSSDAKIVLMSGYNKEEVNSEILVDITEFLFKPDLGDKLLEILSKYIDN